MSELDDLRAANATLVAERNAAREVAARRIEEVENLRVNKRRLHDNIDSLRATVAALTVRNATLERVLADVEAWEREVGYVMVEGPQKTLRTILAGAKGTT